MKKISVSIKQMDKFAGQWVAINTKGEKIIAVAKSFKEIAPFVSKVAGDKTPDDKIPAAFKVPRKNEGPYIL